MGRAAGLARVALALALALGCGAPPELPDGGPLIVPESYQRAAETGGHVAHVGAALPDGGLLTCSACHDLERNGFLTPGLLRCKDCHPERADFRHAADAGLPEGERISCTSCHPFLDRPGALLLSSPWECIECHQAPMGRRQAIVVHGAACNYCHQPHRAPFTRPAECIHCHPVDLVHGAPAESVARTCMGCHRQHRPAMEATPTCLACHSDASKQKRAAARVDQSALLPEGHVSCGSCHKPHRFSAKEVKPCATCHQAKPVLAKAENKKAHQECKGCHAVHQPKGAPKECQECHARLSSTHPVKDDLHACKSCHPPHQPLPPGQKAVTCESCHQAPTFAAVTHGADAAENKPALACNKCHPPHAFHVAKGGGPALCRGCHREEHATTARVKKAGHAACTTCHLGLPHAPGQKKPCRECHQAQSNGPKGHLECAKCHLPHAAKVEKSCVSCHPLAELKGLHKVKKHQDCKGCHSPHLVMPTAQKEMCLGACHKLPTKHDPAMERCTGCHLFVAPSGAPGPNTPPEVKP